MRELPREDRPRLQEKRELEEEARVQLDMEECRMTLAGTSLGTVSTYVDDNTDHLASKQSRVG